MKIDKAYRLLFVIYAPIAIITSILKILDYIRLSYISYFFFLASLIISLLVLILFYSHSKREASDENDMVILRRKFLVPFLMFVVCSGVFAGYNLYSYSKTKFSSQTRTHNRERIVILLPLDKTKSNQPAYQDGKRQAYGYIDLIEKNPTILDKYDIVFKNHAMDEIKAIEIVTTELRNGTNYFISTMSHISERLSRDFNSLVKNNKNEDLEKPKLIVTVSSSSKIEVKANQVYRFYIRSNEESTLLANYLSKTNVGDRLVAIIVDDNYGRRAQDVFNDTYGKPFDITIPLKISWTKDKIKDEIKRKISTNDLSNTFFIVHYGNGLDNIISSISELGLEGNFLISHPITVYEWYKPVEEILNSYNWTTCYPELSSGGIYESEDIIRDFVYFSIHRLVKTLDEVSISNSTFDNAWKNSKEPKRIRYRINSEGDSEIKLVLKSFKTK